MNTVLVILKAENKVYKLLLFIQVKAKPALIKAELPSSTDIDFYNNYITPHKKLTIMLHLLVSYLV